MLASLSMYLDRDYRVVFVVVFVLFFNEIKINLQF